METAATVQNKAPTVSVITTVYDSEQYIAATVHSVLAQSLQDIELIIVDDGSTDRSMAICQEIDDSRIRYVHQENAGNPAARNAGIRIARGKYIAFIDSDDLWAPDKLARHVAHLETSPEIGISYSYSAFIDENGTPLGSYQKIGRNPTRAIDCFVRNPFGNGSNAVIRAAVFTALSDQARSETAVHDLLFDEELRQAEDFELWVRIATLTTWRIECIPWPLTYYRIYTTSLSANTEMQRRYHVQAIDKIARYAPDLVQRHRPKAMSCLYWYLARTLVMQRNTRQASRAIAQAVRNNPFDIRLYQMLLLGAVALMWMLPPNWYAYSIRRGQRLYGMSQEWLMRWHQSRA